MGSCEWCRWVDPLSNSATVQCRLTGLYSGRNHDACMLYVERIDWRYQYTYRCYERDITVHVDTAVDTRRAEREDNPPCPHCDDTGKRVTGRHHPCGGAEMEMCECGEVDRV